MFAVGEGRVGVICSETIFGEGRVVGGAAVLCVGAEAVGGPCAEVSEEEA